jgi:hypothetical protein
MPSNSTFAPEVCDTLTMVVRLACVMLRGKPRKASFAPSSMTTSPGLCLRSKLAKRERPPAVVSPLILALIMLAAMRCCAMRCDNNATQPLPRLSPYSALIESPTINMRVAVVSWVAMLERLALAELVLAV